MSGSFPTDVSATAVFNDLEKRELAQSLFRVRHALRAVNGVTGEDRAISRFLPNQSVWETEFGDDALKFRRRLAIELLGVAKDEASDLLPRTGESEELKTLADLIWQKISSARRRLEYGRKTADPSAISDVELALRLSSAALRIFEIEEHTTTVVTSPRGTVDTATSPLTRGGVR